MDGAVRTLYVHDVDDAAAVPPGALSESDELVVETTHSVQEGLDRLSRDTFDCVLSTYELPDENGVTFLRHVRDFDSELPFVLHPSSGTERVASEAISADVTEYVADDFDKAADKCRQLVDHIVEAATSTPNDIEAKVRELTEATDDVLWLLSADWEEVLFVNSTYADLWGHSERALRDDPTSFVEAVHPDDRPRAEAAMDSLVDGESVDIELQVDPEEEFRRRVSVHAEPIFDRDGSVVRIAGVSRDVTEERARQRRLEEEKRTVDSIFDALPDVLYTFDAEGYPLRWNEQLEAETGYDADELEEMYVTEFVPDDETETIAESFRAVVEDGRTVTVESALERADGERVPFEFTGAPLRDADGNLRGLTGVGRNISEQRAQQRRFEAVFDNTYQSTGLLSPDGTLLEVNRTAAEFASRDREDLIGEKFWDASWFRTDETAHPIAMEAVETARNGEFFRDQLTIQAGDREAVIDLSMRPVTDEHGEVDLLVAEGRDVTRLFQREQQLRVTNRFLRHNIRNKLNTITGHAKLAAEHDDRRLRPAVDTIVEAADELSATAETAREIHELISEEPEPRTVDLSERLDRALATVRNRHPEAELVVQKPESLAATALPSVHEALAELLEALLEHVTTDHPAVDVEATADDDDAVVTLSTPDCRLPAAERDVLTGDIEIRQMRHARGLGVWHVYWQVWYAGGTVELTDDDVQVRLPAD
ncbi:hypothetical protein BRC99_05330 [Halobacteriales archaeon QS_7_69_60]|nr:MAG: hypothetical protein BRC99_05330 [Halobacteriales archaeon QS_7_69_60]